MADRICSIEGCESLTGVPGTALGYCSKHYTRYRRGQSMTGPIRHVRGTCSVDGCDLPHQARGWCKTHWMQWKRVGDPLGSSKAPLGYYGAHRRVRAARGRAADQACVDCGSPARDWSYRRDADTHMIDSVGRPYSPDPDDYEPRCRACHNTYDGIVANVRRVG